MRRQFKTSLSEERLPVGGLFPESPSDTFLSQSLTNTGDMFQISMARQRRRLPPALLKRKKYHNQSFWPTYRGAVEWIRKRENDLNTALGLLELYPQLIQESSLDGLWGWLSPLISEISTKRKETHKSKSPTNTESSVPFISITTPSGQRKDTNNGTDLDIRLVYILGKCPSTSNPIQSLTQLVAKELQPYFFTKVNLVGSSADLKDIPSCNLVIFVLSDDSLKCSECVRSLKLCWSLNIPVIFVRENGYSLPNPLPEHLFSRGNEGNLRIDINRARSVSPSFPGVKFTRQANLTIQKPSTPQNTKRVQSGRTLRKRKETTKQDISMKVIECYHNSISYNDGNPKDFFTRLFDVLSVKTGMKLRYEGDKSFRLFPLKSETSSVDDDNTVTFLRVPDIGGSCSTDNDSIAASEYDSYDEGLDQVFDDDLDNLDDIIGGGMDSGLSSPMEKETTYIVYPSLEDPSPADGPKIVRWPPKNNEEPTHSRLVDTFSPFFDSPVGFEDVNLSVIMQPDSPFD